MSNKSTSCGKTIKVYADVVFAIGCILSIVVGVYLTVSIELSLLVGILIALLGCLSFWILSLFIYGYGQLIENTDILVNALSPNSREQNGADEINRLGKDELDQILKNLSDPSWEGSIKQLSDEELQERLASPDWQEEYRALCKRELENRKNGTA